MSVSRSLVPVATVVAAIVAIWYLSAVALNMAWERDQAARAGTEVAFLDRVAGTMAQERPVLPAPHQVVVEIWETTAEKKITSKRSLVYHGWITLSATLLGFLFGTGLGMLLAVGIVHSRAMDLSIMPWVIASQTIPILAASGSQTFWKLRWPAAAPYLFASLKIGVAASLVGAIVGEMPTGAVAGLGARLLAGSYYGQTVQIWAALFAAAALAAALVAVIGLAGRITLARMGFGR